MKCVPSRDIDKYTIFYMNFHYTEFTYAWKLVTRAVFTKKGTSAESRNPFQICMVPKAGFDR